MCDKRGPLRGKTASPATALEPSNSSTVLSRDRSPCDRTASMPICSFCHVGEDSEELGPLYMSSTHKLAAHYKCMLFSSGVFQSPRHTINSMEFGDFDCKTVLSEIKRGKRMKCSHCEKSGGTVGCEFRKCSKTYHYSCARKARAVLIDNEADGVYKLYCQNHSGKYGFSEYHGKGNDGQDDGQSSQKRNECKPGTSESRNAKKESDQNGNEPQPGASDGPSKRMSPALKDYDGTSSDDSMPTILEVLKHGQASSGKRSAMDKSLEESEYGSVPEDCLQPRCLTFPTPTDDGLRKDCIGVNNSFDVPGGFQGLQKRARSFNRQDSFSGCIGQKSKLPKRADLMENETMDFGIHFSNRDHRSSLTKSLIGINGVEPLSTVARAGQTAKLSLSRQPVIKVDPTIVPLWFQNQALRKRQKLEKTEKEEQEGNAHRDNIVHAEDNNGVVKNGNNTEHCGVAKRAQVKQFWENVVESNMVDNIFRPIINQICNGTASDNLLQLAFNLVSSEDLQAHLTRCTSVFLSVWMSLTYLTDMLAIQQMMTERQSKLKCSLQVLQIMKINMATGPRSHGQESGSTCPVSLLQTTESAEKPSPLAFLKDLSCGKEPVAVSCVNEHDNSLPSNFTYSEHCCPLPLPHFTVTCNCVDGCLNECSCRLLTARDLAYRSDAMQSHPLPGYSNGLLLNAIDSGLVECNVGCKCREGTCENRLVQYGLKARLQVFMTEGKGWGVRCLEDLQKGTFVCRFTGRLMLPDGASKGDGKLSSNGHCSPCDVEDGMDVQDGTSPEKPAEDLIVCCISSEKEGNVSRFLNHSCDPNLFLQSVFVDTHDIKLPWLAFFTLRDISAGTELTWDYDYQEGSSKSHKIPCLCASRKCCHWVLGNGLVH
uniref:uncharacterized protein n=1 Tax=Myxine glutinosa TaxID=7769 RepID=UPI00358E54F0